MIDERAVIHPSAKLGANVSIGAFSVIGAKVEIGDDTWVGPHVVINGPTKIGRQNKIFQFASVGECPQDKKYAGEDTRLVIGDRNVIREGVTISRGTAQDQGLTQIGDDNLFMAYVHIAHDCIIKNHCIFANSTAIAGHVKIDDYVIVSGLCGVHQFVQLGAHCFISHASMLSKDVPPYVMISEGAVFGLNVEGLRRRGYSADTITQLRRAYKIIYRQGLRVVEAIKKLEEMLPECAEIGLFIDFLKRSERGIVR